MRMVALIPARKGSKRIPGKNTKILAGHPLIAYTIAAAKASGVFDEIAVCSDDPMLSVVAGDYGATGFIAREPVDGRQCDIVWVRQALREVQADAFAILRPTAPFRTADTIRRAFDYFRNAECSSIRAVERTTQHPGKMWQFYGSSPLGPIAPVIGDVWPYPDPLSPLRRRMHEPPWHSQPTQSLPPVYVQNASLEMAWTWCVTTFGTISGPKVYGFETVGHEGFDLNTPRDWREAEYLIASGEVTLPELHVPA